MSDRVGKFFLKQRGAQGIYQICWYEGRQTRGISCHTSDVEIARKKLAAHALRSETPVDSRLAPILGAYIVQHAGKLASAGSAKIATRRALEIWGDIDTEALDRRAQLAYVEAQRAAGYSDWTIQNQLGRIWAGMQWARRDNARLVVPEMITAADWHPVLPNRDIVYTPEQLGALLSAASAHEHWWRFVVLAIGTAGREAAVRELTWQQVDLRLGRISLNPEGRMQTKKRRAIVPIAPTLALELRTWGSGEYVLGKHVRTREFFDRLLELTGLEGGPNAIRHTVRTWMAEEDVPDAQADMFMGHKGAGSHTGARYTHRRPEYLAAARASVESLFQSIAPYVVGRALQPRGKSAPGDVQLLDSPANEEMTPDSGSDIPNILTI